MMIKQVFETRITCAACFSIHRLQGIHAPDKCPVCGNTDGRTRFQIYNGDTKLNSFQIGEKNAALAAGMKGE